jgi:uncharacterized iron-regulated membrane protein
MRGSDLHPGWGLFVPAAILLVLAGLSWLLPQTKPTEEVRAKRAEALPVPTASPGTRAASRRETTAGPWGAERSEATSRETRLEQASQ